MPKRQFRPGGAPATSWAARDQAPRLEYDISGERIITHGVLDYAITDLLTEILDAALARRPPHITLDVADVRLLDAATVRALVAFHQRAETVGCAFCIAGADRLVRRVLDITDTLPLLTGQSPARNSGPALATTVQTRHTPRP
jgi:anti-anti-sigma factor